MQHIPILHQPHFDGDLGHISHLDNDHHEPLRHPVGPWVLWTAKFVLEPHLCGIPGKVPGAVGWAVI